MITAKLHASELAPPEQAVQFARDVLPILSTNCFSSHGPDENERQAGLRLGLEAGAKQEVGPGAPIVAGKPDVSGVIARLTSTDPSEMMPPPDSGKQIEPEQVETIRRWITLKATKKTADGPCGLTGIG